MNNFLIGPFLPSIWRDLFYGRLNIEDLAMLRRVCKFFRDDEKLNGRLDFLKEKLFNKSVYFPQPILFNLKNGNKLGCHNLSIVDLSNMREKYYKNNIHYMMITDCKYGYRIYFFTSSDIMKRIIKNKVKHLKYRDHIMTSFTTINYVDNNGLCYILYIWGLENIFIKNNKLYGF